jgi:hypothetical protein
MKWKVHPNVDKSVLRDDFFHANTFNIQLEALDCHGYIFTS